MLRKCVKYFKTFGIFITFADKCCYKLGTNESIGVLQRLKLDQIISYIHGKIKQMKIISTVFELKAYKQREYLFFIQR